MGHSQPPMILGAAAAQPLLPQGADVRLTEAIPSSYDDPAVPAALSCSLQPSFPITFPIYKQLFGSITNQCCME